MGSRGGVGAQPVSAAAPTAKALFLRRNVSIVMVNSGDSAHPTVTEIVALKARNKDNPIVATATGPNPNTRQNTANHCQITANTRQNTANTRQITANRCQDSSHCARWSVPHMTQIAPKVMMSDSSFESLDTDKLKLVGGGCV